MKNIIVIISLFFSSSLFSQVAMGKESVDGSAILDFAENTNKALILPWTNSSVVPEVGALTYNSDSKKIELFNGSAWQDLSVKEGSVDLTEIQDFIDINGTGLIIGNESTSLPNGVLILNNNSKALVLPKNIQPWTSIKNPEPGTVSYDPTEKVICFFNGTEWTFWGL